MPAYLVAFRRQPGDDGELGTPDDVIPTPLYEEADVTLRVRNGGDAAGPFAGADFDGFAPQFGSYADFAADPTASSEALYSFLTNGESYGARDTDEDGFKESELADVDGERAAGDRGRVRQPDPVLPLADPPAAARPGRGRGRRRQPRGGRRAGRRPVADDGAPRARRSAGREGGLRPGDGRGGRGVAGRVAAAGGVHPHRRRDRHGRAWTTTRSCRHSAACCWPTRTTRRPKSASTSATCISPRGTDPNTLGDDFERLFHSPTTFYVPFAVSAGPDGGAGAVRAARPGQLRAPSPSRATRTRRSTNLDHAARGFLMRVSDAVAAARPDPPARPPG